MTRRPSLEGHVLLFRWLSFRPSFLSNVLLFQDFHCISRFLMRGPKFCSEFLRSLRVKSQIDGNNVRRLTNGEITWSCLIGHDLRTHELKEFCEFVEVEFRNLLSHSKTRWLSLLPGTVFSKRWPQISHTRSTCCLFLTQVFRKRQNDIFACDNYHTFRAYGPCSGTNTVNVSRFEIILFIYKRTAANS